MRDCRRSLQREKADHLITGANIAIPERGCGFPEISAFQEYYTPRGIAIVVYELSFGNGDSAFLDGRKQVRSQMSSEPETIYLVYDSRGRHFDTILNITAAAGTNFFYTACNKRYRYVEEHKCSARCAQCYVSPPCTSKDVKKCEACNREFLGQACFENHLSRGSYKKGNKMLCNVVKVCDVCRLRYNVYKGKHECGVRYCKMCLKRHPINDLCYIHPIVNPEPKRDKKNGSII